MGDYVRLAVKKSIFEKGYTPNWSSEIYVIIFLNPSNPPTYRIKPLNGDEINWNHYKEDLQIVPDYEFPYDSFQIVDESKEAVLVKKLNSEDQQEQWVRRVQPARKVKK